MVATRNPEYSHPDEVCCTETNNLHHYVEKLESRHNLKTFPPGGVLGRIIHRGVGEGGGEARWIDERNTSKK